MTLNKRAQENTAHIKCIIVENADALTVGRHLKRTVGPGDSVRGEQNEVTEREEQVMSDPVEMAGNGLKDKYRNRPKSTHKSGHNDGGIGGGKKKKNRTESGAGLLIRTESRKLAQSQTRAEQMVLVISGNGKRTWVRARNL